MNDRDKFNIIYYNCDKKNHLINKCIKLLKNFNKISVIFIRNFDIDSILLKYNI